MKVVIHVGYGAFSLSDQALSMLKDHDLTFREVDGDRGNPHLIDVVTQLGPAAGASGAKLKIVEIPDGIEYEIQDYDGDEWVAEKHRTWS